MPGGLFRVKFEDLISTIQKTTKEQWKRMITDRIDAIRRWIQDSPEVAALAGFLAGFIVALAFKVFIIAMVVLFLMGFLVWSFAPDIPTSRPFEDDEKDS